MTHYQVIARKYRPQTFKEVLGQEPIVQTLKNALKQGTTSHAYLFSGSRGTGKTTLARILAKALNCLNLSDDFEPCNACASCKEITEGSSLDVIEIDGASHRGIEDMKVIAESVGYRLANGRFKIYIIDEVHMLTKEAFNALLKTLEEPPPYVKFFFATTEAQKIPQTIISRCQRFTLQRIPLSLIVSKLRYIADTLSVSVDDKTLFRLARFAQGAFRDAESLFDQLLAYSNNTITCEMLHEVLGLMPQEVFLELDQAVFASDLSFAFTLSKRLFSAGKSLSHFLEDLCEHYKALLFTKLSCPDLLTDLDAAYKETLLESSKLYTQEQCLYILDVIMQADLKNALSEQIALEHCLSQIIRARLRVPVEYLLRRLSEIEKSLNEQTEESAPSLPPPKPSKEAVIAETSIKPEQASQISEPVDAQVEMRKKARFDTLMQFAATELEGSLQKQGGNKL